MIFVRMVLLGSAATFLQGSLAHLGLPASLMPQLALLIAVFGAFSESSVPAVFGAFSVGLIVDLSSATILGPWSGAFVVVYLMLSLVSQRLFIDSGLVAAIVSFFAALLAGSLFAALSPSGDLLRGQHLVMLCGQAVVTALVAPWLFAALSCVIGRPDPASLRGPSPLSAR